MRATQGLGPYFIESEESFAVEIETDLGAYLDALAASLDDEAIETMSGVPYCGCDVCLVREILAFVVPRTLHAQQLGRVELLSVDPWPA